MRPSAALAAHRERIRAIAKARGASNVRVFGSVARGADRDGSDLDLLVDVAPDVSLYTYVGLQLDLQEALGVRVDVCTQEELHPELRERILREARPV
ncbi:MAG: nucleotidyltransferase family protein [Burkholderiales bacterium]|nr:nucleotidyltransferase family protein [Burkholderiales bacterium]